SGRGFGWGVGRDAGWGVAGGSTGRSAHYGTGWIGRGAGRSTRKVTGRATGYDPGWGASHDAGRASGYGGGWEQPLLQESRLRLKSGGHGHLDRVRDHAAGRRGQPSDARDVPPQKQLGERVDLDDHILPDGDVAQVELIDVDDDAVSRRINHADCRSLGLGRVAHAIEDVDHQAVKGSDQRRPFGFPLGQLVGDALLLFDALRRV